MPGVFETAGFADEVQRLTKKQQEQIENIKDKLSKNFQVGKVLRYPFLREKKIQDKRIYFLIYEEFDAVLLIAISDKKAQQTTIDKIEELLPEFRDLMKEFI